jgi:hypothetical protein
MRWRASISTCLGAVLVVALGLAAVRSASAYWVTAVALAVLFWLSASVIGSLFSDGRRRVFWTGSAVFGWAYLLVTQSSLMRTGANFTTLGDQLRVGVNSALNDQLRDHLNYLGIVILDDLFLLAFSYTGGLTALYFAARRGAARRQHSSPPPGTLS